MSTHDTLKTTTDPVCGSELDPRLADETYVYNGELYRFCCGECRTRFAAEPDTYTVRGASKAKGRLGRWLDRLAAANRKTLGGKRGCCH
ncbi:MAG: YHS domain-containing protein [Thermodesulfobacteriota bacterium]|nr:YHS domain-containing protein [Thermodesulfobacteriota bacterium]